MRRGKLRTCTGIRKKVSEEHSKLLTAYHEVAGTKYNNEMKKIRDAEVMGVFNYFDKEKDMEKLEHLFWRLHCAPEHERDSLVADYFKACGVPHDFCDTE